MFLFFNFSHFTASIALEKLHQGSTGQGFKKVSSGFMGEVNFPVKHVTCPSQNLCRANLPIAACACRKKPVIHLPACVHLDAKNYNYDYGLSLLLL